MTERRKKQVLGPLLSEDSAERKRVLNVLAQRRYRERKRARLQELEHHAADCELLRENFQELDTVRVTTSSRKEDILSSREKDKQLFSIMDVESMGLQGTDVGVRGAPGLGRTEGGSKFDTSLPRTTPNLNIENCEVDPISLPTSCLPSSAPCATLSTEVLPLSNPYVSQPSSTFLSMDMQDYFDGSPIEGLPGSESQYDVSAELQTYDTTFFSFPDDGLLTVPSLILINAATRVAQRLNIAEAIWDFAAISPFYNRQSQPFVVAPPRGSIQLPTPETFPADRVQGENLPLDVTQLPSHLRPTPTQRLVPHHPALDLLPWPTTRDKLIQVFHLPAESRPKNAQGSMGLWRLMYDMEDASGEGLKVHGQDPFDLNGWELGQVLFERWWWAFEISVVESSNRARKERGQEKLTLQGCQL